MPLLTFQSVSLSFGDQVIFRDADFALEPGERVCLIGRNGAGKSTLFKLITGTIQPDDGEVVRQGGLGIAQLDQAPPRDVELDVREFVAGGLAHHRALIARYHALTATPLDDAGMRELEGVQRDIEIHGGWDVDARVAAVISELDLPARRRVAELSGGWQRRACLGRALVARPDLLLLDEPTNHLDLTAIEWLENHVRNFGGTVLFITHDRAFLRNLATRIVDIDRGRLRSWAGDYDRYLDLREQAEAEEARNNALFDRKLADEENWIRQGIKARRTRNEGRVRALERMRSEYAARVKPDGRARIELQDAEQSSRRVIEARHLCYAYGEHAVIRDLSLKIMRGDRIGLIGNNGVGKSTLLRLLLGEITPASGTLKLGENLETAYFDQLRRELDPRRSVADIVGEGRDHIEINGKPRHVVGYLRGFLFSARRAMTPVGYLSGGECNRVILARLFSRPSNLLVLDEPTNDLDVETLEVLEAQLAEYQGTVIVVSHDRAFLDNVVTSTIVFEADGEVRRYPGGYSDWLRQGRGLAVGESETPAREPPSAMAGEATSASAAAPTEKRPGKLSYKLQYELDGLPARIEQLETAVGELEAATADAAFYAQPYEAVERTLTDLASRRGELDRAMSRWDELDTLARNGS
ncbi:MAG: ATP-binding cassette domain-containing protein [Gammaproteobacteria bacterium]